VPILCCIHRPAGDPILLLLTQFQFQTPRGTRQGSELSPLLFGLFMDLLHELLQQQAPGAGPTVGALAVPDVMYADDVNLLAWSPVDIQRLLDCLSLVCTLFEFSVNHSKKIIFFFRRPRAARPTRVLTYRGQPLQYVEQCTYLGLTLHATKGFGLASAGLALKGRKALLGLLPMLRRHHISQGDMRLHMFDITVEQYCPTGRRSGALLCVVPG
jgi:hypothetical protein